MKLLLRAGADVNAVDHEGWTALHVAASWNLHSVICELADFSGDVLDWDCRTQNGETAIDLSLNGGEDQDVLDILEQRGYGKPQHCIITERKERTSNASSENDESDDEFFDAFDDTP